MTSFFQNGLRAKILVGCLALVALALVIIYGVSQWYELVPREVTAARAASPTPTPVPPAATPMPPTATPAAPPTATPMPPTPTPVPQYELLAPGGRLTAATWFDDDHMYIADYEGDIRLLNIRTGETRKVLADLSIPRGLTILDERLYVSEMGDACSRLYEFLEWLEDDRSIRSCSLSKIRDEAGHNEVMKAYTLLSHARILSYRVLESGNLTDRQTVVDGLITVSGDHAPNGLANDGEYVYASIGHPHEILEPDNLFDANAELFAANGRRPDLMGAIARFRPPDGEVEVFASGLRNTYQISIAPDGTIYGADNDVNAGYPTAGRALEELNAIVKGGFYGFPIWGTNEAPPEANVTEPVAILNGVSSTVAYANEEGVYVAYRNAESNRFVVDRFDYETFTPTRIFGGIRTYITSILEQDGLLYILTFDGDVYIINPDLAPITSD